MKLGDISGTKKETSKRYNLRTSNKNRNIRDMYGGINDFKQGYQPRAELAKDKKGDLLADSYSILNKWNTHFCPQLTNVGQTEIHTCVGH